MLLLLGPLIPSQLVSSLPPSLIPRLTSMLSLADNHASFHCTTP